MALTPVAKAAGIMAARSRVFHSESCNLTVAKRPVAFFVTADNVRWMERRHYSEREQRKGHATALIISPARRLRHQYPMPCRRRNKYEADHRWPGTFSLPFQLVLWPPTDLPWPFNALWHGPLRRCKLQEHSLFRASTFSGPKRHWTPHRDCTSKYPSRFELVRRTG